MKARTMIYLEPEELRGLKRDAHARGISLAELLRQIVQGHLKDRDAVSPAPREAFLRMVGLGSSGRKDISDRHDAHLAKALHREHAR